MFFAVAALPLLLSSAAASPISSLTSTLTATPVPTSLAHQLDSRQSSQYQVTAFASADCSSDQQFSWPIDLSAQGPQCRTVNVPSQIEPNTTASAGMASIKVDNLPQGKCVHIEFSNSGTCPFDEGLKFPDGQGGNGCFKPKTFDSSTIDNRDFFNFALTLVDC